MLTITSHLKKQYRCIFPETRGHFEAEIWSCFAQLIKENQASTKVIAFTVFVNAPSSSVFEQQRQSIGEMLKPTSLKPVPHSVVSQPPFECLVAIEAILIDATAAELIQKNLNGIPYLELKFKSHSEIVGFGLTSTSKHNIETQSDEAFEQLNRILNAEGLHFNHLVRQWNYVENITCEFEQNGCMNQNYQVFNTVRAKFYNSCNWPNGYPAATGIGMQFGGVDIDFIAIKPSGNVDVKRIANPLQTDAHQYSSKVLVGMPMDAPVIATPKFERAKAIIAEDVEVYVSGTAAIHGEQTLCHNIAEQTFDTIENIKTLVSVQNLEAHGIFANEPLNCIELRVYLREGADADAVKRVMQQHFPTLPFIVVTGNVCRNNLWVEIEGVFCA